MTMKYLSIDIETGGTNPLQHSILEIAAIYDSDPAIPICELQTFHRIVRPRTLRITPFCLKMHEENGLLNEILKAEELPEYEAVFQLISWMQKLSDGKLTCAGKNFAGFDRQFLQSANPMFEEYITHRTLDIGNLYLQLGDEAIPDMKECLRRAVKLNIEVAHRAMQDARDVVCLVRAWFQR